MRLALINPRPEIKGFQYIGDGVHQTGSWLIDEDKIDQITEVYLFDKQKTQSWFGGKVVSYYPVEVNGSRRWNIVFKGTRDFEVDGSELNWGQEKAYF